jgi:chromosome segregation protein
MRLNSIKLSGFKSFVEPTQFQLPGQLVGVVGPNGCGKSNIIDAVRWVLGESKASELRGESMQDVIFNGSGLRKPPGAPASSSPSTTPPAAPAARGTASPRSPSSAC